jgi:integrase
MSSKHAKVDFPIAIKGGLVMIYRTPNKGYDAYTISYFLGQKRVRRKFAVLNEAIQEAKAAADKVKTGEVKALSLTNSDADAYVRAIELLKATKMPLEVAALHFSEAVKILGSDLVIEAAKFYAKRHPQTVQSKSVSDVYNELLDAKAKDGLSDEYLRDLRYRLGRFSKAFVTPISNVAAADINYFLRMLEVGPRGRNNYRTSILTLFSFAESSGCLPKGHLDVKDVSRAKEPHSAIEIFSAHELKKLLNAARLDPEELAPGWNVRYAATQGLLPLLALAAFAGLRTAEIQRQLWTDINLERGFIRVTAAKGNTAQKRLVPISDNLKQWLTLCWRNEGTCCDYAKLASALARLAERADVKWKRNALRHSFISYRVALTQDIPQVSLEAGNSVQVINKHYRELVTAEEAKAWFAITPKTSPSVQLKTHSA